MSKSFIVIAMALIGTQTAMAFEAIPSLYNIPIAKSISSSEYREAAVNAQKAILLQTNVDEYFDSFRKPLNKHVSHFAKDSKKNVELFIENYTPFNPKHIAFTAAAVYTIAVTKSYTQKLGDPLIEGMKHTLTVGEDKVMTGVTYSF